jgi:hypothetical protein
MAINYTNLFTIIGKAIQACNYYNTTFSTMKTNGQEFSQEIVDLNLDSLADGTANAVSGHISGLSAGCSYWQSKVTDILLSSYVTNELPVTQITLNNVLAALYEDMVTNAQTVLESFLIVSTQTEVVNSGSVGDLVVFNTVDRVSSMVTGAPVMPYDVNTQSRKSEVGVAGTVYCKCTGDSTEGQEQFLLYGTDGIAPFSEDSESVGGSITLPVSDSGINLFTNGNMETYSGGFTGWTIDDAGGTLVQETSLMYRGASAARINTLANADTVEFEQTLAEPLVPGKGYIMGFRYKSVAAESGGAITFTATVSDGTQTATMYNDGATFPITDTNWRLAVRYFTYPRLADPTEDTVVTMISSPSVDNVDGIIFDDFFLIPATFFNGAAWGLINGSARFRTGDLIKQVFTRPSAGVIQEFFRKTYGIQLYSAPFGDPPTIDDALAT